MQSFIYFRFHKFATINDIINDVDNLEVHISLKLHINVNQSFTDG